MASLYLRGGVWCIKYQVRGRVVRKSLRTRDKKQAQKDYEEIIARLRYGRLGISGSPADPLMAVLFEEHLVYCKAHLSPRTFRDRNLHIRDKLNPFFGAMPASNVSSRLVEEFVGRMLAWTAPGPDGQPKPKPYAPRTINLHLETLRRVLTWAHDRGDIAEVPCKIKRLREPKGLPRYAPMHHLREWLTYLDLPWRIRALLSICTGITDRDLGYVMLEGCDLHDRFIRFRRPKTTTDIVVPLNNTALQVLGMIMDENTGPHLFDAVSAKKEYARASKAYKAAGGINITPHMLRHTFATELLSQGVPIAYLRDLLGHADIRTTQIYAKVVPEYLRESVMMIEGPRLDMATAIAAPSKKPPKEKAVRVWTAEERMAQAERMKGNKLRRKSADTKRSLTG